MMITKIANPTPCNIDRHLGKVYSCDALRLLEVLPDASVDHCIIDPPYGVASVVNPRVTYDWFVDDCHGDAKKWADRYLPIYHEIRRVVRPGGHIAIAMGYKFEDHFPEWFGGVRVWAFERRYLDRLSDFGCIWLCQTREQTPVPFPDADALLHIRTDRRLLKLHPCPKSTGEMRFMVEHLTHPGDVVLDCFCGIGATLLACRDLGRRFIGCDKSTTYPKVAKWRLRNELPRCDTHTGAGNQKDTCQTN